MVDGEYWVIVWIKLLLWICKIYFRGIWCIELSKLRNLLMNNI